MDYVRKIVELARVQQAYECPSEKNWLAVEAEIGLQFPPDYKALLCALGEGEFGFGLKLSNPCSSGDYRLSKANLIIHREPIIDLEDKLGFPLYPNKGGHVVVASIDRQDFYLKPTGKRLEKLVWLDVDMEEMRELDCTVSQFIHDLYLGLIDEPWAEELQAYFWRDGQEPFFKAQPGRVS